MKTAKEWIDLCIKSYIRWSTIIGYYSPRTLSQALEMIDKSANMVRWCESKDKWITPTEASDVLIDLTIFEGQNFIIDDVLELESKKES